MAGIFELLDQERAATPAAPAPPPGILDSFDQGLRAGFYGGKSQLNTLAGTAMDAISPGLGADRRAASQAAMAESQRAGSRLTPLEGVNDVGSGLRYVAGMLGSSTPQIAAGIGAGLLTGGGALPMIAAGTLAQTPFEAGESLQRMQADPVASRLSAGQQLGVALPSGLAAAGIQSIVPGGTAAKVAGKLTAPTMKRIGANALLDIPGEGFAEGAGEGIRQVGLNVANPNAGYDLDAIGRNALEGAIMGGALGGVGAAGQTVHKYGSDIAALPGRAIDAAKGLVPESAQKRAGEALGTAQEYAGDGVDKAIEAANKAAEWAKGSINARVADVKAWGQEFMADEAAPDSFKAQVQDAINNPGDKAKAVWLATQKFAKDTTETVKAAVEEADIPTRLRELGEKAKTSTLALRDKIAGGQETADPAELAAAANPDALAEVFAKADRTTAERVKEWGSELLNDNLGPEKTEQVKQWMATAGDKISQQGIAALHKGQEAIKEVGAAIERFNPTKAGVKKSEVSTEGQAAVGGAISRVLGAKHPALSDPKKMRQFAAGLKSYINDVANGKTFTAFDKLDQLEALYDVAGERTTELLKAVHTAVSGAGKADTAVFKTLNEMDAIAKGRQDLLGTMQKNLNPAFQRSSNMTELKAEAEMLKKWARSKTSAPGVQRTISDAEIQFDDNRVRSALQFRYGDKADLVMKAVEASTKAERNMIDGEAKRELDSDEAGIEKYEAGEVIGKDPTNKGGREFAASEESDTVRLVPQNKQLYMDPAIDDDPSPYGSAAQQRLDTAKKNNPGAAVQFRKASELDDTDPKVRAMIRAKKNNLIDAAMTEHGMTQEKAEAYAEKYIDQFGLVTIERSKRETGLSISEVLQLKMNAKYKDSSPSAIDAGEGLILDAVKITTKMAGKLKGDYVLRDDAGGRFRQARMFMEGVAAAQAQLGRSFKIPDSVEITHRVNGKPGMTFGEARKLSKDGESSPATQVSKRPETDLFGPTPVPEGLPISARISDKVQELNGRKQAIETKIALHAEDLIDEMKSMGIRLTKKNVGDAWQQAREPRADELEKIDSQIFTLEREHSTEDGAGRQRVDKTGFEGEIERGIDMSRLTSSRKTKDNLQTGEIGEGVPGKTQGYTQQSAKAQRINEINGALTELTERMDSGSATNADRVAATALRREREILQSVGDQQLGTGRSEIDPFGPTLDATRGEGEFKANAKGDIKPVGKYNSETEIKTNADGSPRGDTVMGRRKPATPAKGATTMRYQAPGRKLNEDRENDPTPITKGTTLGSPVVQAAKRLAKGSAASQALSRKLFALIDHKGMSARDEAVLEAIGEIPIAKASERAAPINKLYEKYKPEVDVDETSMPPAIPFEREPPSPKALAAKKAALLKAASSSDPALLKELRTSDDAKALQRVIGMLPEGRAFDAAAARLRELVANPDVAYNLQTKKYSMQSDVIHAALGRPGFAATHDSPHKFDGRFDWRTHAMKGEGAMVKGAGTYLSTSDMVHGYYKAQFSGKGMLRNEQLSDALAEARSYPGATAEEIREGARESIRESMAGYDDGQRGPFQEALRYLEKLTDDQLLGRAAPTYHLSIDIEPDQLMNWDKPLSEQSEIVQAAALKAIKARNLRDGLEKSWAQGAEDIWYTTNIGAEYQVNQVGPNSFKLFADLLNTGEPQLVGTFDSLAKAQAAATQGAGLDTRGEDFYRDLSNSFAEGNSEVGDPQASDYLQSLGILGHRMKASAKDGVQNPNYVIYDDSKIHTNYVHFSLAKSHSSPVDEITVHGKVWNLGGGVRAVEATHAQQAHGERQAIPKGKVYVEGFTADGDQFSGWVDSLDQAREFAANNGVTANKQERVKNDDGFADMMSAQGVTPGAQGPINRKAVMDYLSKVLGPNISLAWTNILHAGEFERTSMGDVIRLSIHSLNPQSVAYHEALHGLFAKLNDAKHADIREVLEKAGESAAVQNQLKKLLANEPAALAQLTDPEERAAYMYQFWAQGKLTVGPKVETLFQRIAAFIRQVTGLLTNDERAVQILEYFHSGEYNATRSNPNAVHRALMEGGMKGVLDKAAKMVKPLAELTDTIASAGGTRLRDSGIPALRELADAMKLKTTSEGTDPGFLPAARMERSRLMNQFGTDLKPYSDAELREALESMQTGVKATGLNARIAAKIVDRRLQEMLKYMQAAGVQITALGMKDGVPYFPRSWDASFISAHQGEFLAMLEKYVLSGELKGDPKKILETLMVTDGNEFGIETDRPGMQNAKARVLAFIKHADAAPFMRKDLHQILNSYTTQATRRAEWAERFGGYNAKGTFIESQGIYDLLAEAKQQGATPTQLKAAQSFIRAVDGTLGDTINPALRRLQGNIIVYENIRLLPLAIFSSIVDPAGIAVRGGTVGDAFKAFKRGIKEMVKNFQASPTGDAMTELAEAIGTIDNAALVHAMGASYSQGMVGDTGRKWNDTFFRLNLMEQFNTSMRVSATEAALKFLARHATKPDQHSARYLKELGLTAADVQVSPSGRTAVLESDGLTTAQSAKMKAAVNRWVDGAVLRPDAVDKPMWMSDPHFALVAHLKQFVFSFHETILKRVVHEAKNGNYTPAVALASYVPIMIAADFMKGMIQGGGEEPQWKKNWGASDYVWSGMERAGLFGVGQFGLDVLQDAQRGGTGVGALSGPAIEQMMDAVQVMGGRQQFGAFALKSMPANALYAGLAKGESTDPDFVE